MTKQQLYPQYIKNQLEELWNKEKKVLSHIIAVLTFDSRENQKPTDTFFRFTQVVPPTRFRQVKLTVLICYILSFPHGTE